MARHLEFDREQALEAATLLFWRQGYVPTSLSQLLEAMGIGRSSFYATFGDKRSVFIEALTLFSDRTREILLSETGAPPQRQIRRFFEATLFEVPRRRAARGCMMVNTVLELADVDDELCALATRELNRIETEFQRLLAEASAAGTDLNQPPREGARFLMLINQGLRVASRQGRPRRELAGLVDSALSMLGLPAAA